MRPATDLVLEEAEVRLVARLKQLVLGPDPTAVENWIEYAAVASALAAITPVIAPGATGRVMTTRELASAFGLSSKTARRKGLAGELPVSAVRLGERGRAALRWSAR